METKASPNESNLRLKEKLKIHCGREHFKALGNDLDFKVASDWREFRVNLPVGISSRGTV